MSRWCGKLTRAQTEDQVSPEDALSSAAWILSAERGWAALYRRAEHECQEPDQGALAAAFAYLADARATERLPDDLARDLGQCFGVQAEKLRVHVDQAAAEAATLLHARAFTLGWDLYFSAGAYDPHSSAGIELIAHEVAHVAQHQRGQLRGAAGELSRPNDSSELEADDLARAFVRDRAQRPKAAPPSVDRDDLWEGQAPRQIEASPRAPLLGRAEPLHPSSGAAVLRKAAGSPRASGSHPAPPIDAVFDLLGRADFAPTAELAAHLEKAGAAGAEIRVRFGDLSPVSLVRVRKAGSRYVTVEDAPQIVPVSHPLFVPTSGILPVLRLQIGAGGTNAISGYLALASSPEIRHELARAIKKEPAALGLRGFDLTLLGLQNELHQGLLTFGTRGPTRFELGDWVHGELSFGLSNQRISFDATANVHARGLRDAELRLARDDKGQVNGSAQLEVNLGDKFTGTAIATYQEGDVAISGELSYASEKFRGRLGLMVADIATAEQMVRAQLDPLGVQPIAGVGGAGSARPIRRGRRTGERGIAGWGSLDFAFTDWLVGTAQVVYGPTGHLSVIGKISPPHRLDLMTTPKSIKKSLLPQTRIEASYGLPYVADVHLGVGVSLSAHAELGPISMTDLAIEGLYSTDPRVMNAFSVRGALRAQAHAGLSLDVQGYAGLRVLKHSVRFGAGISGEAGIKAHTEAQAMLGYRETASPTAGKQGEYSLKGHLDLAAQPVIALGGRLFIELDSPWWSPAPDKTWEWPIGALEYPLPARLGVGADVDHVIGSDKWPELTLTEPSFDPHKFVDTLIADRLPAKSGAAGEQHAPGQWQGVTPTKPTTTPSLVDRRTRAEAKPTTARSNLSKPLKGKQTPEETKNVPGTLDVATRWNSGMEELGELRRRSESAPETKAELHQHLAAIKTRYGFTTLTADRAGDVWLVDAAMNPQKKDIPIKADPHDEEGRIASESSDDRTAAAEGLAKPGNDLQLKSLVEPNPATIRAEGPLVEDLVNAASGQVLFRRTVDPKEAVQQILRKHKDAHFDRTNGALVLPPVVPPKPDTPLVAMAADLAKQTGVSRVTVAKEDEGITLRGEVNPWTPLAKVQRGASTGERLQLAEAVKEFHEEFTVEEWQRHFALGARQAQLDLKSGQEMSPPRIVKAGRGRYQLKESGWRTLKADIVKRFKCSARQKIVAPTFGLDELALFCEGDEKLPKERTEFRDKEKMTKVLDVLVQDHAVRRTSNKRWEFVPIPERRFLPADWTGAEVRARFFENGSGFSSERDRICGEVCAEVVAVISLYERAAEAPQLRQSERQRLQHDADMRWGLLRLASKVSKDERSYPGGADAKRRYSSTSSYHADHIEPLAWLWEHQRYNDVPHATRLTKCGSSANLRGMWGPDNSGRGARGPDGRVGEYMRLPWVGPSFTGPSDSGDTMDAGYGAQFRLNP